MSRPGAGDLLHLVFVVFVVFVVSVRTAAVGRATEAWTDFGRLLLARRRPQPLLSLLLSPLLSAL
ncbi:hypothetical protein BU26DRAFT_518300 [Trematosphaeria pertusa]|uniref:Uncharacterized protein n=1 Tax=Trematosphaeria pertusa TaxID=390896 RepID=A0A6A6IIP1_9PLEO|nr:uncharacterized protein BU26DRAFT_518300 [Trematosphaeria pertusa]KAF2249742.1 hypothetical protein BU26DRAFT_518300 [Trematosphaeria pertusa]